MSTLPKAGKACKANSNTARTSTRLVRISETRSQNEQLRRQIAELEGTVTRMHGMLLDAALRQCDLQHSIDQHITLNKFLMAYMPETMLRSAMDYVLKARVTTAAATTASIIPSPATETNDNAWPPSLSSLSCAT